MDEQEAMPIGSQRIPSIPREGWTDAVRDVFAIYEGDAAREAGSKFNFIHWFANHPPLAQNWLRYNHALTRGVFDPRLREIVILRVAWRYQSDYEWDQHVHIATPLGIGPAHFDAVKTGPEDPLWSPIESLCLRATDQLCNLHDIDDETWGALAAEFDAPHLMELLFIVGSYALLAWALRTVRMPLEGPQGSK
jgi:alkylhydroperoxidase family enzyme